MSLTLSHYTACHSGIRWRSWLTHCDAFRKVVGSIPDGVTGIFHWHNPPAVVDSAFKRKWMPEIFPGCKGGRCVCLTTLPSSCADCLEIWEPQPPTLLRVSPEIALTFTHFCQRLSRPQSRRADGRIKSLKNSNDAIGSRTCDLSAGTAVSQTNKCTTACWYTHRHMYSCFIIIPSNLCVTGM
jgi:hypothetical protein